jgi:predicted amidohydrolase
VSQAAGALRVAVWQCVSHPLDVAGNLARLERACERAAAAGCDVLVTPEMFTSGYDIAPDATRRLAEPADGPTARAVAAISARTDVAVAYGYPELGPAGEIYNAAQLVDRDRVLGRHRKLHLFGDLDMARFTPGGALPEVISLRGQPVGMLICYDVEFPEATRHLALAGAKAILVPTANMVEYDVIPKVVVRARSYENSIYLAYANYVGEEGTLTYGGLSVISTPQGTVLAQGGRHEQLLVCQLELDTAHHSYLAARRSDLFCGVIHTEPLRTQHDGA